MRQVAIVGIGQTSVGEHWGKTLRELAGEAIFAAFEDAGHNQVEGLFISNMMSAILSHQENLGSLITDWIGLPGIEAMKVEAACGSGGAAVRAGIIAVASGELDSVLVMGIEKMTESAPKETTSALATAADQDHEAEMGLSFVAINALVMQRYLHETGWQRDDFAPFPINAHANAVHNPFARLKEPISLEGYHKARMIAQPISLLDASPTGDGAAALLLVPAERLRGGKEPIVTIAGSASASDSIAVHGRRDATWLSAAELSAKKAYQQAGIGPAEIDIFELHDAFSIMAVLSLEACGFAERGQGPRLGLDGEIAPTGRVPICTQGGLKARGHPVGATGVYQVLEVVQQLRGKAGANQVEGAKIGMTQNIGGSGATVVTHILTNHQTSH